MPVIQTKLERNMREKNSLLQSLLWRILIPHHYSTDRCKTPGVTVQILRALHRHRESKRRSKKGYSMRRSSFKGSRQRTESQNIRPRPPGLQSVLNKRRGIQQKLSELAAKCRGFVRKGSDDASLFIVAPFYVLYCTSTRTMTTTLCRLLNLVILLEHAVLCTDTIGWPTQPNELPLHPRRSPDKLAHS